MKAEKLKKRIAELEQWLKDNHTENLLVPTIQADLRQAKSELAELESDRTFERDTFDIREFDFNTINAI